MSGGHFDYRQYHISDIADSIEVLIKENKGTAGYNFKLKTMAKFNEAVIALRKAEKMVQRIDWLVCSDDSEDTFHKRWNEEIK